MQYNVTSINGPDDDDDVSNGSDNGLDSDLDSDFNARG